MLTNSQTNFLPSIETNEFLPPISRWTTFGGLFILIVLGLAVPISAVTKYKVTVKGSAVIRPDGGLPIVQTAIEAIWYLFLKYKGFRKADLRSPATIRVQENEKS